MSEEIIIQNGARRVLLMCSGMGCGLLLCLVAFPFQSALVTMIGKPVFVVLALLTGWTFMIVLRNPTYVRTSDMGLEVGYPVPVLLPWGAIQAMETDDSQRQRPGFGTNKEIAIRVRFRAADDLKYASAPLRWYGNFAYRAGYVSLKPHLFEPWEPKDLFEGLAERCRCGLDGAKQGE